LRADLDLLPRIVLHKNYISKPPIHGPYFTQEGDRNHIRIYIGGTKTRAHASKHREEGDEAMDGTPHGYIGKSWRLKEAWAPLPPLGARSSLMAMGPNLSILHAWMHVRVQMTMHVPRSGSYFSSRRDTKCVHLLLTYAAHVKFFNRVLV